MAAQLVQSAISIGNTGTHNVSLGAAPISGNVLWAFYFVNTTGTTHAAPSGWTALFASVSGGSGGSARSFRAWWKISDGSETSTITFTGPANHSNVHVLEFSGLQASPLDVQNNSGLLASNTVHTNTALDPGSGFDILHVIGIGSRAAGGITGIATQTVNNGIQWDAVDAECGDSGASGGGSAGVSAYKLTDPSITIGNTHNSRVTFTGAAVGGGCHTIFKVQAVSTFANVVLWTANVEQ